MAGILWQWAPSWSRVAWAQRRLLVHPLTPSRSPHRGLATPARRPNPLVRLPALPNRQPGTSQLGPPSPRPNRIGAEGFSSVLNAVRSFCAAAAGVLLGREPAQAVGGAGLQAYANAPSQVFELLHREVESLQAALPSFLLHLEGPTAAPLELNAASQLVFPDEGRGPWDVHAVLEGAKNDEMYDAPIRVLLRFGPEWPSEPPSVRVQGMLSYPLLDRSRSPPKEFFSGLQPGGSSSPMQLLGLLEQLHSFMLRPVDTLGLDSEDADQRAARRAKAWVRDVRRANEARTGVIRQYKSMAKHPELFEPNVMQPFHSEWLSPELKVAVAAGGPDAWQGLLTEHVPGEVYSFPLFTDSFCNVLLEEIFGFYASGLPARRPNSMNAYGIILNEIGLEPFVDRLQALLQPLGHFLFPGAGSAWDGHHCFVVRYREGEDLGLDMHTDDSDVTFNVCLGLDFAGAGLQFCGSMGSPQHRQHSHTYQHRKGHCVVHLGRRRHGADDITSGERLNLILWNHGSTYRRSEEYRYPSYQKEAGPPSPLCVSYTHDRDYGNFKAYPKGKEPFRRQGWCPPSAAEYKGFRPDSAPSVEQTLSKL